MRKDDERIIAIRDNHDYSYVYGKLRVYTRGYANKQGLRDEEAFDDVFQNSVVAFFLMINNEDFELTCKLMVLFVGIFKRQMFKYFNTTTIRVPEGADIGYDYEEDYNSNGPLITRIILGSLDCLNDNHRAIIYKMYFEDKSQQEICEDLGFSNTDSIKAQKYKALKKITPIIKWELARHGITDYKLEF